MATVELLINDKSYTIACDPGEEPRVKKLEALIDQRFRTLGTTGSDSQRFLMVCLMLADELQERIDSAPSQNGKDSDQDLLVAAVDHLSERIDLIAERLTRP